MKSFCYLVIDQIEGLVNDITRQENFDLILALIYYLLFVISILIMFMTSEPDIYWYFKAAQKREST